MWPPMVRGISQFSSRSMVAPTTSPQLWAPFTMGVVFVGLGIALVTVRREFRQWFPRLPFESGVFDEQECPVNSFPPRLSFQRVIFLLESFLEPPPPASFAVWAVPPAVSSSTGLLMAVGHGSFVGDGSDGGGMTYCRDKVE